MSDDHRASSRDLAPRTRGDLDVDAGPSASTLEGSFAGSVDQPWQTWDQIPAEVMVVLDHHGCAPQKPFVTGASAPWTRRQGTDAVQLASAWAVDRSRLILIDAVRGLDADGAADRWRPSTPWRLEIRIHPYAGEVKERSGAVPVDVATTPGSSAAPAPADEDAPEIIELLPGPVRRQILTTVPTPEISEEYLFQGVLDGVPRDHEAGLLRASAQTMIATRATRSIPLREPLSPAEADVRLAGTPWRVRTLTARLGGVQRIELTSYAEDRRIAGTEPPALPGGATRRELT